MSNHKTPANFVDKSGMRFGRWTVLRRSGRTSPVKWECRCDCGIEKVVHGCSLATGASLSCGCYSKEVTSRLFTKNDTRNAAILKRFITYRNNATYTQREFSITIDEFVDLSSMDCWYCGEPPSEVYIKRGGLMVESGFMCNGLDRSDNSLGYTKSNVVACCNRCNMSKKQLSVDSFLSMCKLVANKHI